MVSEIESIRRRVNVFEYRMILDVEEIIKYIRMRFDENERVVIIRLMKVKNMIE